jgi:hypothetical protein
MNEVSLANRPSQVQRHRSFGGAKGNCPTFHSSPFTLHSSARPRQTRSRVERIPRQIAAENREASSHEPSSQPVKHQGATSPAPSTLEDENQGERADKPYTTNAGLGGRALNIHTH